MDLSCTKGDRSSDLQGFVLGINSQLVEIDSNHRLSRIVRNFASPNIVLIVLRNDGYDEHGSIIQAMVTTVCY